MKRTVPVESASAFIDEKIKGLSKLGDWRGKTLAKVREIIHEADPEIVRLFIVNSGHEIPLGMSQFDPRSRCCVDRNSTSQTVIHTICLRT